MESDREGFILYVSGSLHYPDDGSVLKPNGYVLAVHIHALYVRIRCILVHIVSSTLICDGRVTNYGNWEDFDARRWRTEEGEDGARAKEDLIRGG